MCGCNKETSLRSAPVCVLSVSVQRAAWPCALFLTWPRAAPSLAGQPREPSLTTAVLAESRCCLPARAHPRLLCRMRPRLLGAGGRAVFRGSGPQGFRTLSLPVVCPLHLGSRDPGVGAAVGQR